MKEVRKKLFNRQRRRFLTLLIVPLKLKEFDLDLNFGKYREVSHIFQQADASIHYMDIDIANGHVTVIELDQTDIRVECEAQA